jgi:tight adherence protein B
MLVLAFIAIMLVTFATMAFVSTPSDRQKAIERRMVEFRDSGKKASSSDQPEIDLLKSERDGQFSWLESLLQEYQLSKMLEKRIMQADSNTTVAKLLVSSGALALFGFAFCYLWVPILPVQVAVALILAYIPLGVISFKRARRIAAFNAALPDAIDVMGRALRAGHSMIASINIVAEQSVEPVRYEFGEVFKQQNFGLPLRDALTQMLDHVPSPDLRVLVTGILVQKETGGNLAEILDRTVAVIRDRMRIQGEIKTHTAQGRLTGWILCLLPVVMLLIINIVNPGYSKVLVDTPLGHKLIYIGVFLLSIGGLIIRQIINGIEV